jgi:Na+-driven multidrug efflux pump
VIAAFLGVPGHAFASILFFIAFFVVFVAYYFSMAYVVNEDGLVYRGATDFQHFEWEDILQVDSIDMPLGGYYVTTKQGSFVLSSFVAGHRKLVDMIVTRANLVPT